MKLKYNRSSELEVVSIGVFKPNAVVTIDDEVEAKRYLDSGYFDEVKEKERKVKVKKIKKYKKEEVILNEFR